MHFYPSIAICYTHITLFSFLSPAPHSLTCLLIGNTKLSQRHSEMVDITAPLATMAMLPMQQCTVIVRRWEYCCSCKRSLPLPPS